MSLPSARANVMDGTDSVPAATEHSNREDTARPPKLSSWTHPLESVPLAHHRASYRYLSSVAMRIARLNTYKCSEHSLRRREC